MSFDPLAAHYRWMERFLAGNRLQYCRTLYLDDLPPVGSVLIAGEGNGRFLPVCRRSLPNARITCVDASSRMLEHAKLQVVHQGLSLAGIEFVHADLLEWSPPSGTFDLIVTQFFLDCFRADQLRQVVASLAAAANQQAQWLVADFCVPPAGLARYRALVMHYLMYGFFRALVRLPASVLTPPDGFLRAEGFSLVQRTTSEWGLLHSDKWLRGAAGLQPPERTPLSSRRAGPYLRATSVH